MSNEQPSGSGVTGAVILARAPRVGVLLDRITAAGLALDGVWLVGGAVRDAVLGLEAGPDIDLAVEGAGIAFAHLLATATGGEVVAEHAFGTATVVVDLGAEHGLVQVDVATTRSERYAEPGALPSVTPGATIEQDLLRRDVSVNAIAVRLAASDGDEDDMRHDLVDPTGGLDDLSARVIRVLHDASFVDDPTRIFRVARYAGRLGFRVADHTRELALRAVDGGALGTVSAERVRSELELVLRGPAWSALTLLDAWGVIHRLEPRLESAFRPPLVLASLDDACGADPALNERAWPLRLAALVRPLGDDAAAWMSWLGFPSALCTAVSDHVRLLTAVIERPDELRAMPNSDLYLDLGEVSDDSIALAALAVGDGDASLLDRIVAYGTAVRDTRLTIRGADVIAAGVPAGPRVGRILGTIFLRSLDGEIVGEDAERAAIAELAARDEDGGEQ